MWDGHLETVRATENRIELKPETRPIRQVSYLEGSAKREIIRNHIDTMLREGVLEPFQSEWAWPVVLARKKNRKLRFSVDYRRLNLEAVAVNYLLPRIEDCIESLGDAAVFSMIYCNIVY